MKLHLAVAGVLLIPFVASAQNAPKPCDDLKSEIAKKLDARGVTGYALTIADKGKEPDGKIVGSCGGGKQSVVYQHANPVPHPKPDKDKKPH